MANSAARLAHKRRQESIERMSQNVEAQNDEPNDKAPQTGMTDDEHIAPPQEEAQDDNRFERLQGKTRKLESDNAQILRELEEAKNQIAQLKNPPPPQKSQKELDEEFESQLRAEIGEDSWDYMDDASRRAIITIAKRNQKAAEPDVDAKVQSALQQRDEQERSRGFVRQMDGLLKERGTSFIQLMNNEKFETWVQGKRSRLAVFEDAMRHRDDDAAKDLQELVAEFYGGKPDKGNTATPQVKASSKSAAPKSEEVTYEQYMQAVKDKRHPAKREAARKTIAAYYKQQEQ